MEKQTEAIKVRFGSDQYVENRYTKNGIVLGKPEEDKMDFALWFPLEFLNQNENEYSLRWVFTEKGTSCKVYSYIKKMITHK